MDGKITISRAQRSNGNDEIRITIHDEKSVITFFEGTMSTNDFARAITNLAYQPIDFEVHNLENVGKRRERKTEIINLECREVWRADAKKLATEKAKEYEVDGWVLSDSFSSQGHFFYNDGNTYCRANFVRWIDE